MCANFFSAHFKSVCPPRLPRIQHRRDRHGDNSYGDYDLKPEFHCRSIRPALIGFTCTFCQEFPRTPKRPDEIHPTGNIISNSGRFAWRLANPSIVGSTVLPYSENRLYDKHRSPDLPKSKNFIHAHWQHDATRIRTPTQRSRSLRVRSARQTQDLH